MFRFINREEELEFLERRFREKLPQILIVYGRRRVGKTELIKTFCEGKKFVYFLADKRGTLVNSERFAEITAEYFKDVKPEVKNFDNAFRYTVKRAGKEKMIIVIDEFSYLVEKDSSIPSVFQLIVDEIIKGENIVLILCGSLVSMMESLLSYKNPLYGRRTGQWKVEPLKFNQIKNFFRKYTLEQRVQAFSISGGVPFYLSIFDENRSIISNIKEKILTKGSLLYEEIEFLLREELRDYSTYFSILEAIVNGNTKISEIANFSKVEAKDLPKYLNVLIKLGIVERIVPVTEKLKSKKAIYLIKDNFFRFWFKFVYPNKSYLEIDNTDYVIKKIGKEFNSFVGKAFEEIGKELLIESNRSNKLPFKFDKIGKWWYKDKEIDVVLLSKEKKKIAFFEVKWQDLSFKEAEKILKELEEKARFVSWFNKKRREYFGIIAKGIEKKGELKRRGYFVFDLKV